MYIDRNRMKLFPYSGIFYRMGIDESLPLDQQKEEKIKVLETNCDILESSHTWSNNAISAKYVVFMPFDRENDKLLVRNGDYFESSIYGLPINGKVIGVFPSQLDGVKIYIQDMDK